MANQSPDRREVLAMLSKVAALANFPVFSKWAYADTGTTSDTYHPRFFSQSEYRLLEVLCELIIPADDTPGAREAGVSEFVDFMVSQDDDLQYKFRTGLSWFNALAAENYGKAFIDLNMSEQESLLTKVQQSEFFLLARKYTVIGYYTSRVGLKELDYPGLRFYSESPECRHKDDPEHRHLNGAR
jgi:gluconate 2-dehydrogenase gamma chain